MKLLHRLCLPGTALALSLAPLPCASAESVRDLPLSRLVDAASIEDLADMVVTDSKTPQARDVITQNIVVLRRDEIERQPEYNRNLAELLRYTSGQFVNVLSRNDANWGSYAGLGPKYNSYLLDGLPVDSFVDAMSLDPWVLERVEAHKGPASVMYPNFLSMDFAGNEAPLAGTTNLILRDRVDGPLTRISAGYGSWGTFNGRAYHQDRAGDLSYFVGASDERSDYTQYGADNSWLQTTETPNYDKLKGYAKLRYAFGREDHALSLFVHHTRHSGDVGRPNRDFDHAYDTANLAYDDQIDDAWHVQFKAGQRRYDRRNGEDNYPANLASNGHSVTRQTIRPLDLTLNYKHAGDALLTTGIDRQTVDYETESISPGGAVTRQNDASATSLGLYVQEKVQLGDWVLRSGLRHNTIDHRYALLGGSVPGTASAAWSKNLWSLGARYNFAPELALYANAGSSFMPPAAKQIGGTTVGGSGQLANLALQPENGIGEDLGIDWQPDSRTRLGMRAFFNKVSSAIVDNVVSVAPSQTRAVNAGSATARGIELDVSQQLTDATQWFANLTATRTRVDNPTDADQDGTAIPFAPDRVANLGMHADLPGDVTASGYLHWVGNYWDSASRSGRAEFGGYGVVNLRLVKRLAHDDDHSLDAFLDLNNIGNRRFDMPWGFRDPGFNAFAGLNVTF
jgi:outer membrane receptor protein involved in Fe transport